MNVKLDQQEPAVAGHPNAQPGRLGPIGHDGGTPPQAVVLGMHRSGTSALTGLLDRMGFYAGPDESLLAADEYNAKGYWELGELHAFNEDLLAALGGDWINALRIDPQRLGDPARGSFLSRARELVSQLNSYGPWVIKDPRLCLLLPFWRELLERPLCILTYRDPLPVARSLARRHGLPILVGIALWEHYNRAALAASEGLPRVLVGYRELIDDPAAAAASLRRTFATFGMRGLEGLRELSPADARTLLDSSLEHHAAAPGEELGYLNAGQLELLQALASGSALLDPVPPLSQGAREVLHEHECQTRKAAAQRQSVVSLQEDLAQSAERERSLTTDLQELAERERSLTANLQELAERERSLTADLQELAERERTLTAGLQELAERERSLIVDLQELAQRAERTEEALADRDAAVADLEHRLAGSQGKCGDLATELHRKEQAIAEREELLAAVFQSRSWRLGFGLKRLFGLLRARRAPTALDRWKSLRDR
ncbi:MAG TPA: sulfotransferase [Thermoanaerobaculia bacterium]|nr:sulfotransferase [Thermoanaerobaculia bacterium]